VRDGVVIDNRELASVDGTLSLLLDILMSDVEGHCSRPLHAHVLHSFDEGELIAMYAHCKACVSVDFEECTGRSFHKNHLRLTCPTRRARVVIAPAHAWLHRQPVI
jgi:hypothetical protein